MKNLQRVALYTILYNRSSPRISDAEAEFIRTLPSEEVLCLLREAFADSDSIVESRAFDALLDLDAFDHVSFLTHLFDTSPRWKSASCTSLSHFNDARAVTKLCTILLTDERSTLRYNAAEALAIIGSPRAIESLEYAEKNDCGENYAGFLIADMVKIALQAIRRRNEVR